MSSDENPFDILIQLAGSEDEHEKIREYISTAGHNAGLGASLLDYWNAAVDSGDVRRCFVAFGVIIRQYERENGLEARSLIYDDDSDVQNIVDYGEQLLLSIKILWNTWIMGIHSLSFLAQ